MSLELSPVIDAFIKAKNNYDSNAFVACFAEDAVVQDEGSEIIGRAGIKQWIEATTAKYQNTVIARRIIERDNETVLTAQVSGNFDGSPVLLDFHFVIGKHKISRLSIQLTNE